jgi:cobyrinic acid a,c-diamide synthase
VPGITNALIIAAPRSGAGKTTITLAVLAALRRRGVAVRSAKSGPDYLDAGYHAAVTGTPCANLDSWAMAPRQLDAIMADAAHGAEIVVIESAMGLFDGVAGEPGRTGAPADLAARYRIPVLLVLDVSGQAQSAAAIARGFMLHHPGVRIAGVVLNRVGSDRHRDSVAAAIAALPLPVFGGIRRDAAVTLPERHLGLVQASERADLSDVVSRLADLGEQALDLDAILAAAGPLSVRPTALRGLPPPGRRIALAWDAAFSFAYAHVIAGWQTAGADVVTFSPLADEAPPDACDACWLPGGYPELHAARLAAAARFRAGMRQFAASRPVHGECGGYMVLGTTLEDASGTPHAMLGLLGHATSFARRRLQLGYREATLLADGPTGRAGSVLRGHEFHYASLTDPGADPALAQLSDAAGRDLGLAGGQRGWVSGSFFHVIAPVLSQGERP